MSAITPMAARDLLRSLFDAAVAAAHPAQCLPSHLPPAPAGGRIIVLAAGKAAGAMAEVAEAHYGGTAAMTGIAIARHGYGRRLNAIRMVEAGHPVPDQAGLAATDATLQLAATAAAGDQVLVLLSGGASANWIAPVQGLTLADKQAVTRALLRSGAGIGDMNAVRKHLSRIKGGRLAVRARRGRLLTLAISDVPGDDPAVIGSGPTVPDPTTLADARAVLTRFDLPVPPCVRAALSDPANESPKPGDPAFAGSEFRLIARPAASLAAAERRARTAGYECVLLGDRLEGEARTVAAEHARLARRLQKEGRRAVILSGGELTVTITGHGRGGPNQEYALALALALDGAPGIAALAADTDGTDGGHGAADDPAGAIIDQTTLIRARAAGQDAAAFLRDNNSTGFFSGLGDLVTPGPTHTNVNDFRAILVAGT